MKKFVYILVSVLLLVLASCTKTYKVGEKVHTSEECFAAISKDSYNDMTRYSVERDESSIMEMISLGEVYVLPSYTHGEVTDLAVDMYQVDFDGYGKLWVASKFIED